MWLISCEHASWHLPPSVTLGVDEATCQSQAGWDHGALVAAEHVAAALRAPLFAGDYTRLYVDLNRAADHPDVIPLVCYGAEVSGNRVISPADRAGRMALHAAYWERVKTTAEALLAQGPCIHLSVHSFSPELDPPRRQFDVGVLYDEAHVFETRVADALVDALVAADISVRRNEPYLGTGPAICTSLRRQLGADYAGIEIELSHRVTQLPTGPTRVGAVVASVLAQVAVESAS